MKNLFSLVFILISGLSIAQVPSYVPTNGLVGWWPFNGNANDESGNGNNLTAMGDAQLCNDRFGILNEAYRFTTVINNSRLEFNTSNYNILDDLYAGTISFWVKIQTQDISNHYFGFDNMFMIRQKNGSNTQILFGLSAGTTKIRLHLNGSLPNTGDLLTNTELNIGQWYHIAYTWDGSQEKVYVNGILDNFMNSSNYLVAMPSPDMFCFGGYNAVGSNSTNSDLDDIGIWNLALNPSEIHLLYEGCQLAITSQPQDQSVTTSVGVANFSVASTATNPIYQWQTNLGLGFQNISNAGQYNGATTSSLTVSNLSMSNNNQVFRCIVNDGSCVDTTAEASLTIIDDAGIQTNTLTSLKLYPNPVQDVLHIEGLTSKEFEYEVLSLDGKLLQKGKSQGEISVKELRKGNYVLRVGQQQVSFVKQ